MGIVNPMSRQYLTIALVPERSRISPVRCKPTGHYCYWSVGLAMAPQSFPANRFGVVEYWSVDMAFFVVLKHPWPPMRPLPWTDED
jgi:hypothetical protein